MKCKNLYHTDRLKKRDSSARKNMEFEIESIQAKSKEYYNYAYDIEYKSWSTFKLLSHVYLDTRFQSHHDELSYYNELRSRGIIYPVRKFFHCFLFPGLIWNLLILWDWEGLDFRDLMYGWVLTISILIFFILFINMSAFRTVCVILYFLVLAFNCFSGEFDDD